LAGFAFFELKKRRLSCSRHASQVQTSALKADFLSSADGLRSYSKRTGNRERVLNEGMENILRSIKRICEGRGGKSRWLDRSKPITRSACD
jgi:hypothetical protein